MHFIDRIISAYVRRFNQQHMVLDLSVGVSPSFHEKKKYLLYIHIPFCESLCPFCSFHRVLFKEPKANRYFAALQQEIRHLHSRGLNVSEVYVGGGTPTVLPEKLLETVSLLRELFDIRQVSVETNPNHLREPYLGLLEQAGINRLSVGIQSFDDRLLREMQRYHSYGSANDIKQRLNATRGRFDTLNVDMIFNIPHQGKESLMNDLKWLKESGLDQISYYPLMPATITRHAMSKQMGQVNFEYEREYFHLIHDELSSGYKATSVWCFSNKSGAIDEYIIEHEEYLGIGSGAISYLDGTIYSSSFSLNNYIELVENSGTALSACRTLSIKEQAQYDLLMRLFGLRVDKQHMLTKYDGQFFKLMRKELALFRMLGAVRDQGDYMELTRNGTYLWLLMMREFFMGVNNFRREMRSLIREERNAFPWRIAKAVDLSD